MLTERNELRQMNNDANATAVAAQTTVASFQITPDEVVIVTKTRIAEPEATATAVPTPETPIEDEITLLREQNQLVETLLESSLLLNSTPPDVEQSITLAMDAFSQQNNPETRFALQESLALLPKFQLEMNGPHPDASQLLFSDDGRLLISRSDHYLTSSTSHLWDATNGEYVDKLPDDAYAWSADGRFVVRNNWPDAPNVLDTTTRKTILELPDSTYGWDASFNPTNNLIAYSSDVKTEPENEDPRDNEHIFVVHDLLTDEEILYEIIEPARENTSATYDQIAFSADGRYIAGADLLRMDIWDLTTKQIVTQFPLNVSWPEAVEFTPDGTYVAVAGYDGVQVWNLAEDVAVPLDDSLYGDVQSMRLSSDGKYLAVTRLERWNAGEDGAWYEGQNGTQVWEVNTGREVLRLPEANAESGFIDETHHLLTINEADAIQVWDVDNRSLLTQSQLNPQVDTAIDPTGRYVAGVDGRGHIRMWSPEPFLTTQTLSPVTNQGSYRAIDNLNKLAYLPDGLTLATTTWDGIVRYWDSESGQEKNDLSSSRRIWIKDIGISPDGTKVIIGGGNRPNPAPDWEPVGFTFIQGISDTEIITLTHEIHVEDVAVAPNGRIFATAAEQTQLWDLETGAALATCASDLPPKQLFFLPDGEKLIALTESLVIVCDVETGEVVQQVSPQPSSSFWMMALHPNGRLLAVTETNAVQILDLATNSPVITLPMGEINDRDKLAFSPDGRYLASMSYWSQTVWDSENWQPIIDQYEPELTGFAFSPDGNHLALANYEGTVWVIALADGQEVNRLQERIRVDDFVTNPLVFRPDGKQLAILGRDGKVLLWQWNPKDWMLEARSRVSETVRNVRD